mgnify:CR=1 FL=1
MRLYRAIWSKVVCVIFTLGALHSINNSGVPCLLYTTISVLFTLAFILSCFSTAIREIGYFFSLSKK